MSWSFMNTQRREVDSGGAERAPAPLTRLSVRGWCGAGVLVVLVSTNRY